MNRFAQFSAVLLSSLVACGAYALAQNAPKGDAAKGKDLYMKTGCYYCHGTVGQGGGGRTGGLRIANMDIAFEPFLDQLRHPRAEMPPYVDKVLTDQEVADIHAFVDSLPKPPDLKTIPILNN